eukprot:INCI605.1.p1 GENE.INCI605.1~~INCI605.1.p1  ORF type:complete len:613 (+),score=86.29 INCI605.1:95-1933(+)
MTAVSRPWYRLVCVLLVLARHGESQRHPAPNLENPAPLLSPSPATNPSPKFLHLPAPAGTAPAPQIGSTSTEEPSQPVAKWDSYGICSVSCGGGVQTRQCYIQNTLVEDSYCQGGSIANSKACNTNPCPQKTTTVPATTTTRRVTRRSTTRPHPVTTALQTTTMKTTTTTPTATTVTTAAQTFATQTQISDGICTNSCDGQSCASLLESRSCLSLADQGCMCEECFTYDSVDNMFSPVFQCSTTTCAAASKIGQPCTHANGCSMDDCARNCAGNVDETDDGGEILICTHFFSMTSGGCILYSGCDETRTAGEVGATYAKNFERSTNAPTTDPPPISQSCAGRCSGEEERDHLNWCSCRSDCDDFVNAAECCDDYLAECPLSTTPTTTFTLPPTTTTTAQYPGTWNAWGACTENCNGGKAFRTCDSGSPTECEGEGVMNCNTDLCVDTTAAITTSTRENARTTCLGRCGDDAEQPGDCVCTDVCTSVYFPEECCSDFYARCVVDHEVAGGDDGDDSTSTTESPNGSDIDNAGTDIVGDEEAGDDVLVIVAWALGGIAVLIILIVVIRCMCMSRRTKEYNAALSSNRGYAATMINHVEMQSVSTPRSGEDFVTI